MNYRFHLIIIFLSFVNLGWSQIIINEIYPDPDPSLGLPEEEFIEIMNIGTAPISMLDWEISDATTTRSIITDLTLTPGELAIICADENEALFSPFGTVLLVSSLPSLNNFGDDLSMVSPVGEISDFISYDRSWYNDALKEDGGWTIERRNPLNNCDGGANWAASTSEIGGSPGSENTVFDSSFIDDSQIEIETVYFTSDESLEVVFNKKPNTNVFLSNGFTLSPNLEIESILETTNPTVFQITFSEPLIQNQIYEFSVQELEDCAMVSTVTGSFPFGLSSTPNAGELLINEILFNPDTGGVDFIEIVNISDQLFEFDGLSILELDLETDEVIDFERLEEINRYLLPGTFYVLTTNSDIIIDQYDVEFPELLIEVSIPNYSDEEGKIVIVNELTDELDALQYHENWHAPTLNRVDGVSLERISLSLPTQQETNWYSASFIEGNATPTKENSQTGNINTILGNELLLSNKIFTPDGDGTEDFLVLSFPGIIDQATATVKIFDARGYHVTTLLNNQVIGTQNQIRWDGSNENSEIVPIGHYIIVAEIFDQNGNQSTLKEKVVVSRRM